MTKKNKLTIKNKSEAVYLELEQVLYFQADGNYCDVYFADGSVLNTLTYQRAEIARMIEEQVDEECSKRFVLLGKSYLVNTDYVFRVQPSKQRLTFSVNQFGTVHKIGIVATNKALNKLITAMSETA